MKKNVIGDNLKRIREERGLTQLALAELADVSNIAIVQIETGRRLSPRLKTLQALASALRCALEELHGGVDAKGKKNGPDLKGVLAFLEAFENLSPVRRRFVLAFVFRDESFLHGEPKLAQVYRSLALVPEKPE